MVVGVAAYHFDVRPELAQPALEALGDCDSADGADIGALEILERALFSGDGVLEVKGPVALEPGDLIFLRTDGVEETLNDRREVFSEERLVQVVAQSRDLSADEVLVRVDQALEQHSSGQPLQDDVTMIAIKVLP